MADKVKPFEKIFPYLSYRWRYDDGEYSPYAPFTEVQFLSVVQSDDKERYKNGFNVFMSNNLEEIKITHLPIGREDVVAVDILYTESISSTIYVLRTIEIKPSRRGKDPLADIRIPRRSIGAALPANQLSRHFDSVPLKAKSQEITANRLMYGNYVYKFNQNSDSEGVGEEGFKIAVGTSALLGASAGPSVKTNRTYEVGVVYIDKYGRQGAIMTQQTFLPDANGSSFKTDFTYNSRIKLNATIKSKAPDWALYYRYFIKDTSNTFYNLSAFNTYIEGDQNDPEQANAYLQFDSKDRNKITEDSFLIPRRTTHFTESGDVIPTLHRLPVLSIENEAPDVVKSQVREKNIASVTRFFDNNGRIQQPTASGGGASSSDYVVQVNDTTLVVKEESGFSNQMSAINRYIADQDSSQALFELGQGSSSPVNQTVNVSGYSERLVIKAYKSTFEQSSYNLVDSITFMDIGGARKRNAFKFTLGARVNAQGANESGTGISKGGFNMQGTPAREKWDLILNKFALSDEGADKLKGSFFVKVPRNFPNVLSTAAIKAVPIGQSELDDNGEITRANVIDFETDAPEESNLDLYWESSNTYSIAEHGKKNTINWSNCIARLGDYPSKIYLESTSMLDKFNATELVKSIRVNTPDARFAQEHRKAGLIFSGLYNARTGLNELNQFDIANGIQKELEPNYGSIQKLYALDTNLLAFAEDKVFRILADKDALFNADEGVNVTATDRVLGQAMVYQGNYGISTHPESLVYFNNQLYFTDAKRGVVMQLTPSNGQLFPISSRGMSNFFRDRIGTATKLIGMYDGYKKLYVLSMQGYDHTNASIGSESLPNETANVTLGYSFRSETWPSRYSFVPESGITMGNSFYTFKNGKAYLHHSNTSNRNTFYGTFSNSEIELIFNDDPMAVKEFLTLSYEGTSGWDVSKIDTESDDAALTSTWPFVKKENKYFAPIVSQENYYGSTDQSLGSATADDGSTVYIQGTRDKSGIKGFYNKVRLENDSTSKAELFAVNTENFISQT